MQIGFCVLAGPIWREPRAGVLLSLSKSSQNRRQLKHLLATSREVTLSFARSSFYGFFFSFFFSCSQYEVRGTK